jgi:hypothetical protein
MDQAVYSPNSPGMGNYLALFCRRSFQISGFPGGFGPGRTSRNPRSYDEYLKAYSVAMLPGRQRDNVSYGGKSTSNLFA